MSSRIAANARYHLTGADHEFRNSLPRLGNCYNPMTGELTPDCT